MKKVKIGIVGAGGQRCCYHGGCIFAGTENVEIGALCDNKAERLEHARGMYEKKFGYKINTYLDYNEMYRKGGLDAVYVSGPNYLHKAMTVSAFEAGLHVLCEKPMELTLANADEMINAANKNKKILGLAMQMHYRRRYHRIREIIESGIIGKIAQVWCYEYRGTFIEMKDWVWDSEKSGGAIHEKNCHHYDIMDMWIKSNPTTVYASGNIMKHKNPYGQKSDILDNAFIINDYENGTRGMINICFLANKEHYREFGIHGTEGKIFFSTVDDEKIHIAYNNGDKEIIEAPGDLRGGMCQDFVDCIIEGKEPLVSQKMGRKSLLVPMAAEISIKEKRVVHVNELK
ncbi:MAG: hypothetical protein A2017_15385 [Lentisphaerae bacterium GWF2_44_16]|nr:MAG: hypothetical protein A2017_15385 [Lentisphaerae bacterium GWF2_44_16]